MAQVVDLVGRTERTYTADGTGKPSQDSRFEPEVEAMCQLLAKSARRLIGERKRRRRLRVVS